MDFAIIIIVLMVAVILLLLSCWKYRLNHETDKQSLETDLDTDVEKFLRRTNADSLVVGVYKDGKTYVRGYGDNKPDQNTVFQIGSITKVFTALLLQVLCDEGIIKMDMTLEQLIGRRVKLSPKAKKITLRQLATHTSGLPRLPKSIVNCIVDKVGKKSLMVDPYSHIDSGLVYGYLELTNDNHKAGKFVYSNYGMGLLGHVLESVTGKKYEVLLEEKILVPLNMNHTRINLTPEMQASLTQGYTSKGEPTPIWGFNALEGAGALNSHAKDMLKFIGANFEINSPVSIALNTMRESRSNNPTSEGWMKPGLIEKFFGNKHIDWHNGMVGGYASYLSIDSKKKTGMCVVVNQSVDVTMLGIMLTRKVRTQSWSKNAILAN